VHPYLLFGIPVWDVSNATNLKPLQSFQNKTIKIIGGGKNSERATPCFVKTNILKIKEIYEIEVVKVMFLLTSHTIINFKILTDSLPKLEPYIIDQQD